MAYAELSGHDYADVQATRFRGRNRMRSSPPRQR